MTSTRCPRIVSVACVAFWGLSAIVGQTAAQAQPQKCTDTIKRHIRAMQQDKRPAGVSCLELQLSDGTGVSKRERTTVVPRKWRRGRKNRATCHYLRCWTDDNTLKPLRSRPPNLRVFVAHPCRSDRKQVLFQCVVDGPRKAASGRSGGQTETSPRSEQSYGPPPDCAAVDPETKEMIIADPDTVAACLDKKNAVDGAMDAHGSIESAALETVQILGEIVLEKATRHGLELAGRKVRQLLECDKDTNGDKAQLGLHLRRTCQALGSLRIQELATAPQLLLRTLVADTVATAFKQWTPKDAAGKKTWAWLQDQLTRLVLEQLGARSSGQTTDTARALVRGVASRVVDRMRFEANTLFSSLKPAEQVVALAGLALLECERQALAGKFNNQLSACPVETVLEKLAKGALDAKKDTSALTVDQIGAARTLAIKLLAAATMNTGQQKQASPRKRLAKAADALFDVACLLTGNGSQGACFSAMPPSEGESSKGLDAARKLGLLRKLVQAALRGETNALVSAAGQILVATLGPKLKGEDGSPRASRALRLLGALLSYAETYNVMGSATSDKDNKKSGAKDLHERRKEILSSLAEDMTDRTQRGGEWVLSAGGSLRLLLGARLGLQDREGSDPAAFAGPLALSLGLAADRYIVGWGGDAGIHIELGLVDLGQYLALSEDDDGPVVHEPNGFEMLHPSLFVGPFWGTSMPVVAGLSVGYSPHFDLDGDGDADKRGTITVGAALAVYVPLLDFN